MNDALKFLRRYGPLVASALLAIQAVLPNDAVKGLLSLLNVVGVSSDPQATDGLVALVTGLVVLYGVGHKTYNLIREKYFPSN